MSESQTPQGSPEPLVESALEQDSPSAHKRKRNAKVQAPDHRKDPEHRLPSPSSPVIDNGSATNEDDIDGQSEQPVRSKSSVAMPPPPTPSSLAWRSEQPSWGFPDSQVQDAPASSKNSKGSSGQSQSDRSKQSDDATIKANPMTTVLNEADLPEEPLEAFDWTDLEERYHDAIKHCDEQEEQIWNEFNKLCDFFSTWTATIRLHEVGRSYKRLKTQEVYVQKKEEDLEARREHYVAVVNAFKSALEMLRV